MCYALLLSTTTDADLSVHNTELVRFERELPNLPSVERLRYPNRWYIGSNTGCSCGFRHLYSVELGFGVPVDWYPEEKENLEATLQLIRIVRALIESGECVDCIDAWEHPHMHAVPEAELVVNLAEIKDEEFRLFENHHFELKLQTNITMESDT